MCTFGRRQKKYSARFLESGGRGSGRVGACAGWKKEGRGKHLPPPFSLLLSA